MACVTLKRPLDFDPLHSPNRPPNKRPRRCVPIRRSIDASSSSSSSALARERESDPSLATSTPSVFRETPLTPEEIANNLRDELKRLKKRRQLVPYAPSSPNGRSGSPLSPEPMMDGEASILSSASSLSASASAKEKPIFTLKQMTLICERMCKERTDHVREEYDKILHQKLSEQYDAFVKFVDHQIQKRFTDAQPPSYLS